MRILFAGTPQVAVTVLGALVNGGHEVVGVLTREDSPVGRKKTLQSSPVAEFAFSKGLPVIKKNKIRAEDLQEITSLNADIAIVVAYGSLLSKSVLEVIPQGWFNLHFSLLPKYRGAAPVQHAIKDGQTETGVSLFRLDEGMDTGDLVGQVPTKIEPDENAGVLLQRLAHLGVTLLNQELPRIFAGTATLTPQIGDASFAPKLSRKDAEIDFNKSADEITCLIRAMNPEPMAWAMVEEMPVRVLDARPVNLNIDLEPGSIVRSDRAMVVICGGGTCLEITEIQPAGKKQMSGQEWIRGHQSVQRFD